MALRRCVTSAMSDDYTGPDAEGQGAARRDRDRCRRRPGRVTRPLADTGGRSGEGGSPGLAAPARGGYSSFSFFFLSSFFFSSLARLITIMVMPFSLPEKALGRALSGSAQQKVIESPSIL